MSHNHISHAGARVSVVPPGSYTSARIGLTLRRSPSVSHQERNKIVGILVVITLNFMLVFGPYHLVGGYRFVSLLLTDEPCRLERWLFLSYRLCYGLTSLNTLLDPLFYIFLCSDARLELRRSLPCVRRGRAPPPPRPNPHTEPRAQPLPPQSTSSSKALWE